MDEFSFELLSENLKNQFTKTLPGEEFHSLMAPIGRDIRKKAYQKDPNPKLSAVLLLIYPEDGESKTVLMKRNSYKGVHSAQVSFPGGRKENYDETLMHTAIREAEEEVGIDRNDVEIIGQLTDLYIPPSRFYVEPYVGISSSKPDFVKEPSEVQELLFPSIKELNDKSLIANKMVEATASGFKIETPCYYYNNHIIWGATAMIISEFNEVINRTKAHAKNS